MEFGLKTGSASRGLLGFFVGLFVFSLGLLASISEFLVKGEEFQGVRYFGEQMVTLLLVSPGKHQFF